MSDSPNLALPYQPSGALQTDVLFNEFLLALDALAQNGVQDKDLATPPTTIAGDAGKIWIIPSGATGVWSGKTNQVAVSTGATTWTYFTPKEGWSFWVNDENTTYIFDGSNWIVGQTAQGSIVTAVTSSAGVLNINCALGDYFTITLTENITSITFSNLPAAGRAQSIMLRIRQHASAAKTVAWPAAFKWAGGVAGAVSVGLSDYDVLAITTFDQGTRWEATIAKDFG